MNAYENLASLTKWLSVRLRTRGCGFDSCCSHLIKVVFLELLKTVEGCLSNYQIYEIYVNSILSQRSFRSLSSIAAQKMKFSIAGFFSKCDQLPRKLPIWSYLLKKSLMGNFIFCAEHFTVYLMIRC